MVQEIHPTSPSHEVARVGFDPCKLHHSPSVLIRVLGTYSGLFGFLVYVMSRDSDGVTSGTKAGGSIGNSWIPFLLVSRMSAWKGV